VENKVIEGLGTKNTPACAKPLRRRQALWRAGTATLFSKEGGSHGSKEGSEEGF